MGLITLELYKSAISSMHYFFLRSAEGTRPLTGDTADNSAINEELQMYLYYLNDEYMLVPNDVRDVMVQEIIEGNYFERQTYSDIHDSIDTAIRKLLGEPSRNVEKFYMNLLERGQII